MTHRLSIFAALAFLELLCASLVAPAKAAEPLSYADLVDRMTDLKQPAVLPALGETCKQWSSWDRASEYDAETGKYLRWDANGDGTGIIREEDARTKTHRF